MLSGSYLKDKIVEPFKTFTEDVMKKTARNDQPKKDDRNDHPVYTGNTPLTVGADGVVEIYDGTLTGRNGACRFCERDRDKK